MKLSLHCLIFFILYTGIYTHCNIFHLITNIFIHCRRSEILPDSAPESFLICIPHSFLESIPVIPVINSSDSGINLGFSHSCMIPVWYVLRLSLESMRFRLSRKSSAVVRSRVVRTALLRCHFLTETCFLGVAPNSYLSVFSMVFP